MVRLHLNSLRKKYVSVFPYTQSPKMSRLWFQQLTLKWLFHSFKAKEHSPWFLYTEPFYSYTRQPRSSEKEGFSMVTLWVSIRQKRHQQIAEGLPCSCIQLSSFPALGLFLVPLCLANHLQSTTRGKGSVIQATKELESQWDASLLLMSETQNPRRSNIYLWLCHHYVYHHSE